MRYLWFTRYQPTKRILRRMLQEIIVVSKLQTFTLKEHRVIKSTTSGLSPGHGRNTVKMFQVHSNINRNERMLDVQNLWRRLTARIKNPKHLGKPWGRNYWRPADSEVWAESLLLLGAENTKVAHLHRWTHKNYIETLFLYWIKF